MRIVDPTVVRPRDRNYQMCKFENTYTQDNRQLRDKKNLLYSLCYLLHKSVLHRKHNAQLVCIEFEFVCSNLHKLHHITYYLIIMLKRSLFSIFHVDNTSDSVFSIFFTSHSVFSIFNVRLRVFQILYSVFSIFYTPCFPFFDVTLRGSDSETPAPELRLRNFGSVFSI